MVERENKQVKAIKIDNAKTSTIRGEIVNNVKDNSNVCTDSYIAYHHQYAYYDHNVINHEKVQYSKKHIQKYLGEYTFKYSTKHLEDGERFCLFLQNHCELTYKQLISN